MDVSSLVVSTAPQTGDIIIAVSIVAVVALAIVLVLNKIKKNRNS